MSLFKTSTKQEKTIKYKLKLKANSLNLIFMKKNSNNNNNLGQWSLKIENFFCLYTLKLKKRKQSKLKNLCNLLTKVALVSAKQEWVNKIFNSNKRNNMMKNRKALWLKTITLLQAKESNGNRWRIFRSLDLLPYSKLKQEKEYMIELKAQLCLDQVHISKINRSKNPNRKVSKKWERESKITH